MVAWLADGTKGNADLCAYFFLRARQLLHSDGDFGLLATNTIAEGDTRDVGLQFLVHSGSTIYRAVRSRPWPGQANLEVSHVWMRLGSWCGTIFLDDNIVSGITPLLAESGGVTGNPQRLAANADKSFGGAKVYGQGFVLDIEDALRLLEKDCRNAQVLFPYLIGEDLNSRSDQSPSRWVMNFFDWPLDRDTAPTGYNGSVAADFQECLKIVRDTVKPEREALRDNADGKRRKAYWWQYGRRTPALDAAIRGLERVLTMSIVTHHIGFVFVPTNIVFSHRVVVVSMCHWSAFALLQSNLHEVWARLYSSQLETRLNYSPSDCLQTFPFPLGVVDGDKSTPQLSNLGETYYEHRRCTMLTRKEGLTKTYNRFHDPDEPAEDIQKLRQLHVEMDDAVAAAYDWTDLDLGHGFHKTRQGVRFTISESAHCEVLARLLKLNHERYAEEVAQGLHDKGKKKANTSRPRRTKTQGSTLF